MSDAEGAPGTSRSNRRSGVNSPRQARPSTGNAAAEQAGKNMAPATPKPAVEKPSDSAKKRVRDSVSSDISHGSAASSQFASREERMLYTPTYGGNLFTAPKGNKRERKTHHRFSPEVVDKRKSVADQMKDAAAAFEEEEEKKEVREVEEPVHFKRSVPQFASLAARLPQADFELPHGFGGKIANLYRQLPESQWGKTIYPTGEPDKQRRKSASHAAPAAAAADPARARSQATAPKRPPTAAASATLVAFDFDDNNVSSSSSSPEKRKRGRPPKTPRDEGGEGVEGKAVATKEEGDDLPSHSARGRRSTRGGEDRSRETSESADSKRGRRKTARAREDEAEEMADAVIDMDEEQPVDKRRAKGSLCGAFSTKRKSGATESSSSSSLVDSSSRQRRRSDRGGVAREEEEEDESMPRRRRRSTRGEASDAAEGMVETEDEQDESTASMGRGRRKGAQVNMDESLGAAAPSSSTEAPATVTRKRGRPAKTATTPPSQKSPAAKRDRRSTRSTVDNEAATEGEEEEEGEDATGAAASAPAAAAHHTRSSPRAAKSTQPDVTPKQGRRQRGAEEEDGKMDGVPSTSRLAVSSASSMLDDSAQDKSGYDHEGETATEYETEDEGERDAAAEPVKVKRGRGRPPKDPNAPKKEPKPKPVIESPLLNREKRVTAHTQKFVDFMTNETSKSARRSTAGSIAAVSLDASPAHATRQRAPTPPPPEVKAAPGSALSIMRGLNKKKLPSLRSPSPTPTPAAAARAARAAAARKEEEERQKEKAETPVTTTSRPRTSTNAQLPARPSKLEKMDDEAGASTVPPPPIDLTEKEKAKIGHRSPVDETKKIAAKESAASPVWVTHNNIRGMTGKKTAKVTEQDPIKVKEVMEVPTPAEDELKKQEEQAETAETPQEVGEADEEKKDEEEEKVEEEEEKKEEVAEKDVEEGEKKEEEKEKKEEEKVEEKTKVDEESEKKEGDEEMAAPGTPSTPSKKEETTEDLVERWTANRKANDQERIEAGLPLLPSTPVKLAPAPAAAAAADGAGAEVVVGAAPLASRASRRSIQAPARFGDYDLNFADPRKRSVTISSPSVPPVSPANSEPLRRKRKLEEPATPTVAKASVESAADAAAGAADEAAASGSDATPTSSSRKRNKEKKEKRPRIVLKLKLGGGSSSLHNPKKKKALAAAAAAKAAEEEAKAAAEEEVAEEPSEDVIEEPESEAVAEAAFAAPPAATKSKDKRRNKSTKAFVPRWKRQPVPHMGFIEIDNKIVESVTLTCAGAIDSMLSELCQDGIPRSTLSAKESASENSRLSKARRVALGIIPVRPPLAPAPRPKHAFVPIAPREERSKRIRHAPLSKEYDDLAASLILPHEPPTTNFNALAGGVRMERKPSERSERREKREPRAEAAHKRSSVVVVDRLILEDASNSPAERPKKDKKREKEREREKKKNDNEISYAELLLRKSHNQERLPGRVLSDRSDFFYREIFTDDLGSTGPYEAFVDEVDLIDVEEYEEPLPDDMKDTVAFGVYSADTAARLVAALPRPVPIPDEDDADLDEDEQPEWTEECMVKAVANHTTERQALVQRALTIIKSMRCSELSVLGNKGAQDVLYNAYLTHAARLKDILPIFSQFRRGESVWLHRTLIRLLPEFLLVTFLEILRFLKSMDAKLVSQLNKALLDRGADTEWDVLFEKEKTDDDRTEPMLHGEENDANLADAAAADDVIAPAAAAGADVTLPVATGDVTLPAETDDVTVPAAVDYVTIPAAADDVTVPAAGPAGADIGSAIALATEAVEGEEDDRYQIVTTPEVACSVEISTALSPCSGLVIDEGEEEIPPLVLVDAAAPAAEMEVEVAAAAAVAPAASGDVEMKEEEEKKEYAELKPLEEEKGEREREREHSAKANLHSVCSIVGELAEKRVKEANADLILNSINSRVIGDVVPILIAPLFEIPDAPENFQLKNKPYEYFYRLVRYTSRGNPSDVRVIRPPVPAGNCSVAEAMDSAIDHVLTLVKRAVKEKGNQRVVLFGWGTSCYINLRVANLTHGVAAVINFAFPLRTMDGYRGRPDDDINLTYCPTLFIVGADADDFNAVDLLAMRMNMCQPSGVLVLGSADASLNVSGLRLCRERITQKFVARIVLEQIIDFINLPANQLERAKLVPLMLNNVYFVEPAALKGPNVQEAQSALVGAPVRRTPISQNDGGGAGMSHAQLYERRRMQQNQMMQHQDENRRKRKRPDEHTTVAGRLASSIAASAAPIVKRGRSDDMPSTSYGGRMNDHRFSVPGPSPLASPAMASPGGFRMMNRPAILSHGHHQPSSQHLLQQQYPAATTRPANAASAAAAVPSPRGPLDPASISLA